MRKGKGGERRIRSLIDFAGGEKLQNTLKSKTTIRLFG